MISALMAAIYTRLSEDDAGPATNPLMTAVGSRLYALEAPASSSLPLVVYSIGTPDTERFFDGETRITASIEVSVFAKVEGGPKALADIEKLVDDQLDQKSVTVSGADRGYIRNVQRGVPVIEGEYMRSDSTFEIVSTTTS